MGGDANKINEERDQRASILLPINPLKTITTVPGIAMPREQDSSIDHPV